MIDIENLRDIIESSFSSPDITSEIEKFDISITPSKIIITCVLNVLEELINDKSVLADFILDKVSVSSSELAKLQVEFKCDKFSLEKVTLSDNISSHQEYRWYASVNIDLIVFRY
jgi:molecular chaperone DnaK (HSP70)